MGSNLYGLLPKSISCFDKLSMSGKVTSFQHIAVRPEPVEGQTVGLGNSPFILDTAGWRKVSTRFLLKQTETKVENKDLSPISIRHRSW